MLGPSGCGKTTTLRMIGGFEEPTEGHIYLGDQDVVGLPPYKRDVNTVFQSYALFPHMSIEDNVAFGLERKGVPKDQLKGRVARDARARRPDGLREAKAQAALRRSAAAGRARQSAREPPARAAPRRAARCARSEAPQADAARAEADPARGRHHVRPRHARPGRGDDDGRHDRGHERRARSSSSALRPDLYERPATAFVAGFLGVSNLLPGTVEGPDAIRLDEGTLVRATVNGRSGKVAAGVRPEKITIGAGGGANELPGTVSETAYIGVATQVLVRTAAGTVQVFAQNMDAGGRVPSPGTTVVLSWAPESTFVVDREGSTSEEEHA